MILYCTKAVKDKLKGRTVEYVPSDKCDDSAEGLYSWHADLIKLNRKNTLFLVNNKTRFAIFIYEIKAADFKDIENTVTDAIRTVLMNYGIREDMIEAYLDKCREVTFAEKSIRSVIGTMTEMKRYISNASDLVYADDKFQTELTYWLNYMLFSANGKYVFPAKEFYSCLADMSSDNNEDKM